jgi:hypothetical protein
MMPRDCSCAAKCEVKINCHGICTEDYLRGAVSGAASGSGLDDGRGGGARVY